MKSFYLHVLYSSLKLIVKRKKIQVHEHYYHFIYHILFLIMKQVGLFKKIKNLILQNYFLITARNDKDTLLKLVSILAFSQKEI